MAPRRHATSAALFQSTFDEVNGEISPDGRWLVYQSNESGKDEICVRPFPSVDRARWQVSAGGGAAPMWSRNGRELFYATGSGSDATLVTVPVAHAPTGGAFLFREPQPLFALAKFYMWAAIGAAAGRGWPERLGNPSDGNAGRS